MSSTSDSKLRVLYLNHVGHVSGAEIVLMRMTGRLDPQRFHRVGMCPFDGELAERFGEVMEDVEEFPMRSRLGGFSEKIREYAGSMVAVFRAIKKHRVDLVHANSFRSALVAGPAGRLAGVPVIWHMHDILKPKPLNKLVVRVLSLLASGIVGPSDATCKGMTDLGAQSGKMNRIYNGLDVEGLLARSKDVDTNLKSVAPGSSVVMVGQVTEWKGQHVLLGAMKRILEKLPQAHAFIVGEALYSHDVEYKEGLLKKADAEGLSQDISWMGFRKDVPALMAQADVIVHASVYPDPLPTIVLEGMALGRVLVASDIGGVPEMVIHEETGYTYPPGDADALAERIALVLENPESASTMGVKAAERIAEHFSIEKNVTVVKDLYKKLLPAHSVWQQ